MPTVATAHLPPPQATHRAAVAWRAPARAQPPAAGHSPLGGPVTSPLWFVLRCVAQIVYNQLTQGEAKDIRENDDDSDDD